ncbi:MAG TPA: CDP-archaeol synthase [Chlamydiales bacterium]|nr:CDP-archaeol synthase [Chlamydiales bacterium]
MKDLPKRVITSLIAIVFVGFLIVFSDSSWFKFLVAAFVALLSGVAIWEYEQFAKEKGGRMILPALITIGMIEVLSFFLATHVSPIGWDVPMLIFFIGFLILIALHFKEKDGAIVDLAVSSFGLVYIAVPLGMLLGVLFGNIGGQDGRWWVGYLLIVTKITDMGAYFGGNLWGKRKLAPIISPGKTVEGAVIGLICAVLASLTFCLISHFSGAIHFNLSVFDSIWLGVVLGCIGQFGDLSESLLKRDANIKDSNVLPGLGGILDMVDSLLFNVFIVFFYLNQSA